MKYKSVLPLFVLVTLSGCSLSIPLKFKEYIYIDEPLETFKSEKEDIYYQEDKVNTLDINVPSGINIKTGITSFTTVSDATLAYDNTNKVLKSSNIENINGVQTQKLLVVPIYFTDSSVADSEQLKEDKKVLIENAFFGKSEVTKYESVASFYNKSSYGHLRLEGEVLDWFKIDDTAVHAKAVAGNNPENYSDNVIKNIVKSLPEEIIEKYSSNYENIIDSIYVIYDYPYEKGKTNKEQTLFWAYSYHLKDASIKASSYAWSSFDFMGEKVLKNHKVEANTYIHETGHLLGLIDYYNNSGSYQPVGMMDMMDYNLGDHSSFSKYLLNWVSPKVLDFHNKEKGNINIRSFTKSGDCILIPSSSYNKTMFDRYLMIEYFTPTGLNNLFNFPSYVYGEKEGDEIKDPHIFTYPDKYGLRVYEVDARLGYYQHNGFRSSEPECYIDEIPTKSKDYDIYFYHNNEVNENKTPLVHLLESSGNNTFKTGLAASNKTLFGLNATFGVDTFIDLSSEFGVTFKVTSLSSSSATISFTKK